MSYVEGAIEHPGLVWVKDPVNLDGTLSGGTPRRRHHDDCMHFYRNPDGSMVGPPPYRASEEQMRTLPPCQTCAETIDGGEASPSKSGGRRGEICPTCHMERPVAGSCPNCGE